MSLYTFESPRSFSSLRDKILVVDTSYLISLSDPNEINHANILRFHQNVLGLNAIFYINDIVRQEFLKQIRKVQMIDIILYLSNLNPTLKARYASFAGIKNLGNNSLKAAQISNSYDKIYKDHLRKGDVGDLISAWQGDIFGQVFLQENLTQIQFFANKGVSSWEDISDLMQNTGLAPTDAMIANFAFYINADTLLTTDLDFMQVAGIIDVFMPAAIAPQAIGMYDHTID